LHDRELTYSLALPSDALVARDGRRLSNTELYQVAHETLIAALADLGVFGAHRYGASPSASATAKQAESKAAEPFLCFERRTEHDVVLNGAKIAGSAQRKRTSVAGNSAILQHGSILLSRGPAAPSLPGIDDLIHDLSLSEVSNSSDEAVGEVGERIHLPQYAEQSLAGASNTPITPRRLIAAWQPRLAQALALQLESGSITPDERSAAATESEKFASAAWLNRR
jgi:lipoate-protein ligase A